MEKHPYLLIYLIGFLTVILLMLIKIVLFYIIEWLTKANIAKKNLKKLAKPENKTWYLKILTFIGALLSEAVFSWINVIVVLWKMVLSIIKVLRDVFTQTPEEIKSLRYPLKNNPMLSKEAVWAYLTAISIKMGEEVKDGSSIIVSIEDVLDNRPDFDYQRALDQLGDLNVMDSEVIETVKCCLLARKTDDYLYEFE